MWPAPALLVLWPGAGAGANQRSLVRLADGLAPFPVVRSEFPRQRAGGRGRDTPAVAVASIADDVARLADEHDVDPSAMVIGGRSYGGRMCAWAVRDGLEVGGLALLSFPLHPPGKPEVLRSDVFTALDLPCLFVSGERDPFGTPGEFTRELLAVPGEVTHVTVPGAHDPPTAAVVAAVTAWLTERGAVT
ncbi:MAG: dienelactone hydrolase [Acidimicrobiia bacterium]|nr:dienelactone hydrolase [Acidimicrobiia bacterium]